MSRKVRDRKGVPVVSCSYNLKTARFFSSHAADSQQQQGMRDSHGAGKQTRFTILIPPAINMVTLCKTSSQILIPM